jgi:hypothetical protein
MNETLVMLFSFTLPVWAGLVHAAESERRDVTFPSQGLCAPQIFDPGRTDLIAGPSPTCGMIVA